MCEVTVTGLLGFPSIFTVSVQMRKSPEGNGRLKCRSLEFTTKL